MDAELHSLLWAIKDLMVPALAVAITGALKAFAPRLKDAVPGVAWPFVALVFARLGTRFCYAIDAPCEGNFVNWADPEAYAIAQGLAVIGVREAAVDLRKWTPKLLALVTQLAQRPPGPPAATPSVTQ